MRVPSLLACSLAFLAVRPATSQQIYDIWQTTWDRSSLLTYTNLKTPINFATPTVIGQADIVIDDDTTYQSIWGFGGTLTDAAALTLNNLKSKNSANYWKLLNYLFDPDDGVNAGGLSYLRIPLAASDFSANVYSFDDTSGDTALNNFNINSSPSYLFSVINDIKSVNSVLKIHVLPWSPPGWMKDSKSMDGGTFQSTYISTYAQYLLKCLQGFSGKGISVYAISIQNEPQNSDSTYPTALMSAAVMGQVGTALRTLMNNNGFGSTKLLGYEHNWDDAAAYPVQLMKSYGSAFDGVAFHCYGGSVDQQDSFHTAYPNKDILFTECAGTIGSDWWTDIKWYMDNLWIGALEHNSHTGLMWNIALNASGLPKLPGTSSCGGNGCRAIAQVNSDGTYSLNQEFYSMAQASKAILPKDVGGPWGQRIGVSIGGTMNWALRVGAYVTGRVKSTDWNRYSLVVMNWNDSPSGSWDPTPVQTTIEFRGMQASYTFPVGITTLWWYAVNESLQPDNSTGFDATIYAQSNDQQVMAMRFEREEA